MTALQWISFIHNVIKRRPVRILKLKFHLFDFFVWICCKTRCTANPQLPQQIRSKSTTNQIHNVTTSRSTCFTTNPQQIHNKSNKWSCNLSNDHVVSQRYCEWRLCPMHFQCSQYLREAASSVSSSSNPSRNRLCSSHTSTSWFG
jgi:hypothetical protein